ncbi:hypothetical protein JM93_02657 [Roseibium hamelinense]|uniref:Uncharacterized protein n=1 Tax=Roseibium hamelinense TaxID=150831 RepID=A0A562SZ87_9HYPH|nr:hypothetical protein [Roseibium hamelinense]MTI44856.1 hypothetical protein [Roseibium hamelinense]TWI85950.1 hypothetical protein JM93_02657 [Roseibium hamelinense]
MSLISALFRRKETVPCTVEINNTFEALGAHVRFDGGVTVGPGDEVMVEGAPVDVPYGEEQTFRRTAVITRASGLERVWTRATGDLEFMELCEFSFSERAIA